MGDLESLEQNVQQSLREEMREVMEGARMLWELCVSMCGVCQHLCIELSLQNPSKKAPHFSSKQDAEV